MRNCKANRAIRAASKKNEESLSNGSLMRCTPMAVFTSALNQEEAKKLIIADIEMTHPNKAV